MTHSMILSIILTIVIGVAGECEAPAEPSAIQETSLIQNPPNYVRYEYEEPHMGTIFRFQIYANNKDIADKAANSYTKEFLFSQSSNERTILQLVNEALDRLEKGSFGFCVACENEINQKRLEAVPWTRHCISCQEMQEQGLLEEA